MKDLILKEVLAQNDEKDYKEDDEENHKEVQRHHKNLSKKWRYTYGHPKDLIIGDPSQGIRTRSSLKNIENYYMFICSIIQFMKVNVIKIIYIYIYICNSQILNQCYAVFSHYYIYVISSLV